MHRPQRCPCTHRDWLAIPFILVLLLVGGPASAAPGTAITHVTVIDVVDGSRHPDQTVIIEGNRIAAIFPGGVNAVPEGSEIIEGEGKFLIPGLWDMHVHAASPRRFKQFYPLFLANGITGIRDTWGSLEVAKTAREAVASGELAGPPRSVVAGNLVDGPVQIWPGSQVVNTPEEGRAMVDKLHANGAPFIKVYSTLSPDSFFAIAKRARELEIPFAGHVPEGVRVADASDAGMASMEHLIGLLLGCSAQEEAIISETMRALREDSDRSFEAIDDARNQQALRSYDEARCKALAQRLIDNQTWQVPTLVTNRGYTFLDELAAAGDDRLRYLERSDYDDWSPETNRFFSESDEAMRARYKALYARELELVSFLAGQGVPFLAGSDTPNPWAFPGSGIHDELELFVKAGLSPQQALQTATLNPARFFGRVGELGTVEAGKLADLVLLDGDPLVDIANVRKIRAVIADGRVYRRDQLDAILARIEKQAARISVAEPVYEALASGGIEAAQETYDELRARRPDNIRFGESELTFLGYRLLGEGRVDDAIAVFEMNIAAYPEAPNPQDSLGEALTAAGNLEAARDAHAEAVRLAEEHNDPLLEQFRANLVQAERRASASAGEDQP